MSTAFINRLIALAYLLFIAVTSIPFYLIAVAIWLFTLPFDPRLRLLHQFTSAWASLYLWIFPAWSVTIENRGLIDRDTTYVMVSNHQSLVDILVVFSLFTHFKWVSKKEVFSLPLIGWNMSLNRYVRLERGLQESVIKMYEACDHHLQAGSSIYMFPEGTRSATDQMREFKEGAFVLAQNNRVPLLLIAIDGSRDALPKHSLTFHGSHHITLSVLGEIPYQEFADTPPGELAAQVRAKIADFIEGRRAQPRVHPHAQQPADGARATAAPQD